MSAQNTSMLGCPSTCKQAGRAHAPSLQRKSRLAQDPLGCGPASQPLFFPPCFLFPENNSFVLKLNRNGFKLYQKGQD